MRRYDSTAFGPDFEAWRDARHRRKSRLRALRHRFLAQIIDLRRPNWRNHYQRAEAYLGALIAVFRECGDEREAATCARRSSCRLHPRPRRWSSIHISANFFLHLRYVGKINGLNQVDKKKVGHRCCYAVVRAAREISRSFALVIPISRRTRAIDRGEISHFGERETLVLCGFN